MLFANTQVFMTLCIIALPALNSAFQSGEGSAAQGSLFSVPHDSVVFSESYRIYFQALNKLHQEIKAALDVVEVAHLNRTVRVAPWKTDGAAGNATCRQVGLG